MSRNGLGMTSIEIFEQGFPYSSYGGYNPNSADRYTPYEPRGANREFNPPVIDTPSPSTALVPYQSNLPATTDPTQQQAAQAVNSNSGIGLLVLIVVLAAAFGK